MGATLLQGLFNIVDMFWVGHGLGPAALAGVGTSGFVVWAILSLAEMPSVGLTAVASRRWGESASEAAAEAGYQAFLLAVGVSVLVGLAGLVSLWPLFDLMNTTPEVTVAGAGYLVIYLAGCPIVFAYFAMDATFRAAGDTRTPLQILLVALAANFVLDPLLILGPGPLPKLGVQGAALATIVTRAASCAIGFRLLARRRLLRRCAFRSDVMGRIAWIGFPVSLGGMAFSLIYVFLARFTAEFGTSGLAALSIGHRIESLSFLTCLGFGVAAATAVGQNLGAGHVERAVASGHAALGYALVVMAGIGAAFFVMPEELVSWFTDDPDVIRYGASYLRIVAVAQLFMALELTLQVAMEGAGYTVPPMIAGVSLTTLRLPLAAWLRGPLGITGIWWTISGTAIARGAVMAALWWRGSWRHRKV